MIKKVTNKSQYLQLIFGLMLILLILPAKQVWADPNENQGNSEGIVKVIVKDTSPLTIPQEFKNEVKKLGGSFIIVGNKESVRLLSLNGTHFNPCLSESSGIVDPSVFDKATHTCKFAAGLKDTITLLAQTFDPDEGGGAGCGTCTANGASRTCNRVLDRFECTGTPIGACNC
jgi:hypothetical protein